MTNTIQKLSIQLGQRLLARSWKLTTAESCTGGLVAAAITEIAGSSGWFERGFITYSNNAKMELLAVPEELLTDYGAVSEETAWAMAEGALVESDAQISVSITGIAGPTGAVPGKPVGTVCFAWALRDKDGIKIQTETVHFDGDRSEVRRQSVLHALGGILIRFR
jgi:nicotinamide-nucleotide amidase